MATSVQFHLTHRACGLLNTRTSYLSHSVKTYLENRQTWLKSSQQQPPPYLLLNDLKQLFKSWPVENEIHFHELLEDVVVIFPALPEPVKNPELQARLDKLKQEQEEREYARMVKNVDAKFKKSEDSVSLSADVKSLRAQMVGVTNFIVSVGGTFAFVYKAVEYSLPEPIIPTQVIAGLLGASIVALAELYFLLLQIDTQ